MKLVKKLDTSKVKSLIVIKTILENFYLQIKNFTI